MKIETVEKKYESIFLKKIYSISYSDLFDIVEKQNPELIPIINSKDNVECKIDELISLKLDYSFDFLAILDGKILTESMMFAARGLLFRKDTIECFEFSTEKSVKSDLYKLFTNHILSYKNDLFLFSDLAIKYPEYLYTGIAYRFIRTSNYNESSSIVGKCFSLNKEGIEFFTENSNFLNAVILKHNIVGFNLIKFLNDHEQEVVELEYKTISDHFKKEQEIVAIEDLGLISIKNVSNRLELIDYLRSSF